MGEDMVEKLQGGTEITVVSMPEVPAIMHNLVALDENKEEVMLSEEDKKELAMLFVAKGKTTGIMQKAKSAEEMVKEVGSPWMLARWVKTVTVPGIGTLSQTNGTNVSISQDNLRKVLVNYLPADKVAEVLDKVVKRTQYTTLQFKTLSPKEG